jgi:hypothetical protein
LNLIAPNTARIPSFGIGLPLELDAAHVRLREVLRVFEKVRRDEIAGAGSAGFQSF